MSLLKSAIVLVLSLAMSGGGLCLSAQQGLGGRGLGLYGVGPRLGENVALALEFQSQLELSSDQVSALEGLQKGIQQDVDPLEAEMAGLRAAILAGEVASADGLAGLQDLFAAYQVAAEPYRTQVASILTPVQHQTLQGIMWETRPLLGGTLGTTGLGTRWDPALGKTQGLGLGRGAGVGLGRGGGLGLARGAGVGLGRSAGFGLGRGAGRGRGLGLRWWY